MRVFDFMEADEVVTTLSASGDLIASVRPSMYSTIAWEWNTVPQARILRLLRAVLRFPELAANIQHVSILSSSQYAFTESWKGDPRDGQNGPLWNQNLEVFSDVVEQSQLIVERGQFPEASKWNGALQKGNSYAYVAILLSQLHNLESLQLDYSFVWKSGFPGLMMKHAVFSTPNTVLSSFHCLTAIDYGSNVPRSEEFDPIFNTFDKLNGYPPCDPNQFMAWFHLPSIQSIFIWLRSCQDVMSPCTWVWRIDGTANLPWHHARIFWRAWILSVTPWRSSPWGWNTTHSAEGTMILEPTRMNSQGSNLMDS